MALVQPPEWTLEQLFAGGRWWWCSTACRIPGNAGTIVRAAEAFGATGVVFLKGTREPAQSEDAARIGGLAVPRAVCVSAWMPRLARAALQQNGGRAVRRRAGAASRRVAHGRRPYGRVRADHRQRGARRERRHAGGGAAMSRFRRSGVESLNAAVAAGILLYEARRQRTAAVVSLFDTTPPEAPERPGREASAGRAHAPGAAGRLRRPGAHSRAGQAAAAADRARRADVDHPVGTARASGKTTLAQLIARVTRCEFIPFSAVLSGIKEIKAVMADAERLRRMGRRTILFIDEIHRFNKAQQDAFLPYVERGDIILIGATTENPSFEVNSALLSRSRVYALRGADRAGDRDAAQARAAGAGRGGAATICWSRSRSTPTATRAQAYNTLEAAAAASAGGRTAPKRRCRTRCSARCCSTTRAARSTST